MKLLLRSLLGLAVLGSVGVMPTAALAQGGPPTLFCRPREDRAIPRVVTPGSEEHRQAVRDGFIRTPIQPL
jgi:hypothetical protein